MHEDIVSLEQRILANPQAGDLVQGTGGLRKIRMGQRSVGRGVTHLVALFGKREKTDLLPAERRLVAALVEQLNKEPS